MLRAIREIKPTWIVGENVAGLLSWSEGVVFEQVCAEMEAEGYEVQTVVLPACGVDAPHRRDRVWIIAHAKHDGLNGSEVGQFMGKGMHNNSTRQDEAVKPSGRASQESRITENPIGIRCDSSESKSESSKRRQRKSCTGDDVRFSWDAPNGINKRLQRGELTGTLRQNRAKAHDTTAECLKIPTWDQWPTQSPLCSRNDGIPSGLVGITISKHRIESIKGYGNAIVPQVAYEIFKAIEQTENEFSLTLSK